MTEPIRGGTGDGIKGFVTALATWLLNGLLLASIAQLAFRWLASKRWLDPWWHPLAAAGAVAACGYVAFWKDLRVVE